MTRFAGRFNDGQRAASHDVAVQLNHESLWILDESGRLIADWPYAGVKAVDRPASGRAPRLTSDADPGARLTVEDPAFPAMLGERVPAFRMKGRTLRRHLRSFGIGLAGVASILLFFWFGLPKGSEALARVIPVSWEEHMGETALVEVLDFFGGMTGQEARQCNSPAGLAALDRLVDRLAAPVDTPYRFKVRVVDLDITNAFALPGGYVVIFDELIQTSKSAEEVAGVLAHEMGHVIHRHSTQGMLREMGLSVIFSLVLGDLGGSFGGQIGGMVLSTSYSREAESEADATGIRVLQAAGVRPTGLAAFFRRLRETDGDLPAGFQILSTHPSFAERLEDLEDVEDRGTAAMDEADWQALRQICALPAEDEEVKAGGVKPWSGEK